MEPETASVQKRTSGPETLTEAELPWLARYEFLKEHGYLLRPRYRPGWTPSWETTPRVRPIWCEDWHMIRCSGLLDAQRISDGVFVIIKEADIDSIEGPILWFFSSHSRRDHPRNHVVPLLDILEDNVDDQGLLLVLPLLRDIQYPPVETIPEALDMIQQTLEVPFIFYLNNLDNMLNTLLDQGLAFLHENRVTHGELTCSILMDSRGMFPDMWHPQYPFFNTQWRMITKAKSRTKVRGVKYYFIDFGRSTSGADPKMGWYGDERAPVLSPAYRFDIYTLGSVYRETLLDEFINVDFLRPLIDQMTTLDPPSHLSAADAYAIFKDLRTNLDLGWFNQRLRKKETGLVSRVLRESSYWLHLQLGRLSATPVLAPLE